MVRGKKSEGSVAPDPLAKVDLTRRPIEHGIYVTQTGAEVQFVTLCRTRLTRFARFSAEIAASNFTYARSMTAGRCTARTGAGSKEFCSADARRIADTRKAPKAGKITHVINGHTESDFCSGA